MSGFDPLHSLQQGFETVEGAASQAVNFLEQTTNDLIAVGVEAFGGLSWLIQHLRDIGEDPFTFIRTLHDHIVARGADPVTVLERFTGGVMQYGIKGYAHRLFGQYMGNLSPVFEHHANRAYAVGTIHQTTIDTSTQLMRDLFTGNAGGVPFTGKRADAFAAEFATISTYLSHEIAALHADSGKCGPSQDQINADFLNAVSGQFDILGVIDLAIFIIEIIVLIFTLGSTIEIIIAIDAIVILLNIAYIILYALVAGVVWLVRTIGLHICESQSSAPPTTVTPSPGPTPTTPPGAANWQKVSAAFANAIGMSQTDANKIKIKDLTSDQRQKLLTQIQAVMPGDPAALNAYLDAHPDITVLQLLQALNARYLAAQNQVMRDQIQAAMNNLPNTPEGNRLRDDMQGQLGTIDASIAAMKQAETNALNGKNIQNDLAPATSDLKGEWAEWQLAQHYLNNGTLIAWSRDWQNNQIDLVIRDGNDIRVVQVKAYSTSFGTGSNQWEIKNPDGTVTDGKVKAQAKSTLDLINNPAFIAQLQSETGFDPSKGKIIYEEDLISYTNNSTQNDWSQITAALQAMGVDVRSSSNLSTFPGGVGLYNTIIALPQPPPTWPQTN